VGDRDLGGKPSHSPSETYGSSEESRREGEESEATPVDDVHPGAKPSGRC